VGADSPEPVIELYKALEEVPAVWLAFGHSTLPPTQSDPLYRSRMTVIYAKNLSSRKD